MIDLEIEVAHHFPQYSRLEEMAFYICLVDGLRTSWQTSYQEPCTVKTDNDLFE